MTRLSVTLMLIAYTIISAGIASAQQGGTVRGQILDTTELQNPVEGVEVVILAQDGTEYTVTTDANGDYVRTDIPAGRYLISIFREGYSDRLGKPVTIVDGGDHYVPLKMTKKDNIVTSLRRFGALFWILILCAITALLTFLFTKRWMAEKSEANQ